MTSLVGKTIGKFKLIEVVGSGGMAEVYRAIQQPLDRNVAVKILHQHLIEQAELKDRFLREAKAVASLSHPNIVQIYDYDYQDGIYYMAMEFLHGDSLDDRLKEQENQSGEPKSLPVKEALQITIQVANALDFAHKQGVIHRDVKPANIMQTFDDRVLLTDFGIATVLHETRLTVEGATTGTPAYMSPEQALGERGDERSDIYSLGAVLYQLVTGQLPFEANTLYGLIMKHVNETPPPATEINPHLDISVERIIQKAMAKQADDRYQTAGEFAADLQAVLDGELVDNVVTKQPNATSALAKYKVQLGWGTVVVVLLAALALGLSVGRDSDDEQGLVAGKDGVESMAAESSDKGVESMAADNPDKGVDSMAAMPPPNQAYSDTFDDNSAGWLVTESPISRQVVDGIYEITIEMSGRAISAHPKNLGKYDKFSYSAEAVLLDGQPESGYGLVFHRQDDENYYVFAVNGLQQWSIWRLEDGSWQELRALNNNETWTYSEAVLPPGEVNLLLIEVDGSTFNLFVNDKHLLKLADDEASFASGGVGFYVASSRTADEPLARIQFDNVELLPIDELTLPSMTSDP